MQRLRIRYAKRGRLRFTSHRDFSRAFERAVFRARVPMAYSSGFNPHPRISYAGAAPTGAASEAEFVEIGLTLDIEPDDLRRELDAVLPEGIVVLDVVRSGPGALADRIDGSEWRIEFPGVEPEVLAAAVEQVLATDVVEVERMTKNGMRTLDVRSALVRLTTDAVTNRPEHRHPDDGRAGDDGAPTRQITLADPHARARTAVCGTLSAVVRHTTPAVRPDDVVSALRSVAGLEPPVPVRSTRTAQGRLDDDGALLDPLELDRAATGR